MNSSRSKYLLLIIVCGCAILFFDGCKKQDTSYTKNSIVLSAVEVDNGIKLTWDKINSNDFIRYEVYRSDSPIPDPTAKEPINSSLLMGSISNNDTNFFIDSTSIGNSYYKVQVVLKLRNLISNDITNQSGFIIPGSFNNAYISKELKRIYFRDGQNRFTVFDYALDSMLLINKVLPSPYYSFTIANNENNVPVLYAYAGSNILGEYNCTTLNLMKNHSLPIYTSNFSIAKGALYLNLANDSVVTYDLATDMRIDGVAGYGNYKSIISSSGNALVTTSFATPGYVTYYSIGIDKKPIYTGQIYDNSYMLSDLCVVSPSGTNIMSNAGGNGAIILDQNFTATGILENPNFSIFNDFIFTDDEHFVLARTSSNDHLEVYNMNTLKLNQSIPLLSASSFSLSSVFLDGNILLRVENTFSQSTGQNLISIRKKTLQF